MSVIFTNLALIGLLGLLVIPLLVHLFARSKPPNYAFSDNRFLRKILKKSAKFQKPQDLLILLLRTLAVLALVATFLQPLLTSLSRENHLAEKKSLVIVIDRSASMAVSHGATSRFDQAIKAAQSILEDASFDMANLVWLDADPDAVFPELGENTQYLKDALRQAKASYENGASERAILLAVDQVEATLGDKKIIVISDFQKNNWSGLDLNIPEGVSIEMLSVTKNEIGNLAVSDLHTSPAEPIVGEKVDIIATVSNYSSEDRVVNVYIDSGGGRSSKEIDVPAWSSAQVIHGVVFKKAGDIVITASIENDDFPSDNRSYRAFRVKDRLRLAVEGDIVPHALERLGMAIPWLEISKITTLDQARVFDFLFVNDWNGKDAEKLVALASQGLTTFVVPSYKVTKKQIQDLLGTDDVGSLSLQEKQKGWTTLIADVSYDAMRLFKHGEYGTPGEGVHTQRLSLNKDISGVKTLLSYDDDVPALIRKGNREEGAILLYNMFFTSDASDWTERTSFVSFMAEIFLAERQVSSSDGYTLPGQPISYNLGEGVDKASISLKLGDESLHIHSAQTSEGLEWISEPVLKPGVYKWMASEDALKISAVNMVFSESDLRTMNPDDLKVGDVVTTRQLLKRASLGDGIHLWSLCVGMCFLLLLLEMVVAVLKPKAKEVTL